MKPLILGIALAVCAGGPVLAQSDPQPKFEAADVHASPKTQSPMGQFARTSPVRGGRYEVKTATLVDLIRIAYDYNNDKILGGPSWLELDRFDVTGKVPEDSKADAHKQMLQSLLEERFKLKVHKETKALPAYALVAGKKPNLKEADGAEDTGCRPQAASGPQQEGGVRLMFATNGGPAQTINLGPGMTVTYHCRNMTMEAFVGSLRGFIGANLGPNNIAEETELKGKYNFDLKYSMGLFGGPMNDQAERIPITAAIEKQLGLKLEERQIPTPVLVVDSVERTPTPNAANIAEVLPPLPVPTAFEVASVKPSDPGKMMMGGFRMQPGGRLVSEGMPLGFLVSRAFNSFNNDEIVGLPPSANSERYDIVAKVPGDMATGMGGAMDMDLMAPLVLNLLQERFGLKYHKENRDLTAYALVAAKPKLKKADPNSRTSCKTANPPPGAPPNSRVFTCTNATMAYLAERLQRISPELQWPIADETELEGGYDLTLVFNMRPMMVGMPAPPPPPGAAGMAGVAAGGGGGGAPAGAMPSASDPTGGQTIFEAIEKQLGLKLEKRKRSLPVIVIDHLEQKPTEN